MRLTKLSQDRTKAFQKLSKAFQKLYNEWPIVQGWLWSRGPLTTHNQTVNIHSLISTLILHCIYLPWSGSTVYHWTSTNCKKVYLKSEEFIWRRINARVFLNKYQFCIFFIFIRNIVTIIIAIIIISNISIVIIITIIVTLIIIILVVIVIFVIISCYLNMSVWNLIQFS